MKTELEWLAASVRPQQSGRHLMTEGKACLGTEFDRSMIVKRTEKGAWLKTRKEEEGQSQTGRLRREVLPRRGGAER